MLIPNNGQFRKSVLSIEDFEILLDKKTYPLLIDKEHRIEVDGEMIRYYSRTYHRAFTIGYVCENCGLKGDYFALERNASAGAAYRLNLYTKDIDGVQDIIISASRTEPGTRTVENIQLLCNRCRIKKDEARNRNEKRFLRLINEGSADYKRIIARCNWSGHVGYLTKALMKSRMCVSKNCPYLEDLRGIDEFWKLYNDEPQKEILEKKKPTPKENRVKKKIEIKTKKDRDIFIRETLGSCVHIYVTAIREEHPRLIEIFYIYDKKVNLKNEVEIIREKTNKRIKLNAVKGSDESIELLIRKPRRETGKVTDVRKAPKVGEATKKRLFALGIYCLEDLYGRSGDKLYKQDCIMSGYTVNRRYLAAYRSAIDYLNNMEKVDANKKISKLL